MVDLHKAFKLPIATIPYLPPQEVANLRYSLVDEEVEELLEAIDSGDLVAIADGAADSIVVIIGTCVAYGIDLRPIWEEVLKTNMAKANGPRRPDGKVLKPEGWQPPRIKELLEEQMRGGTNNGR